MSDECSQSLSVAFAHNPVFYIGNFSENLVSDVIMVGRCFSESWNKILFATHILAFDHVDAQSNAEDLFKFIDSNQDGQIDANGNGLFVILLSIAPVCALFFLCSCLGN